MPVHFLQCDPAASAESVPARKRQHLDCGVPVTVEATTASTRLASHPVTAIESGPSLLLRPLAPSNAAALGDDASVAQSCPPSGHVSPPSCSVFGVHSDLAATSVPLEELGLKHSLARLEAESHAVRLRQSRAVQNDSQTGPSYARHLTHYRLWWESDQARRHAAEPEYTIIPPFPVTAAKVAMFLEYETTREKRQRGSSTRMVPGSTIGSSSVSQAISALERWRTDNHHLYKDNPEAQIGLRSDNRVRVIEAASKRNEPSRIESSQALKAAGTSSDTYTSEELARCSWWCLATPTGTRMIYTNARDRAMLLFSTSTAFRGESARILQWSDLFVSEIPMDGISPGSRIQVLAALADNAKHNKDGRVDEHGALRHRKVELCPVGAIAMMFFSYFHILCLSPPRFEPDFTNPSYGEYGHRSWYECYVFPGERVDKQMSYDNHRDRVKRIHSHNNVNISKVTHAARPFAAQTARSHGATASGTKALGGWNDSGAFRRCYDRTHPVDALLGAAMFNGRKPDEYFLARDILQPPEDLLAQIFPWAEQELEALLLRAQNNTLANDMALKQFLKLLIWLRKVLLQDAAVLFMQDSTCAIFRYSVFQSKSFRDFAAASQLVLSDAEAEAHLALEHLPGHLIMTLRGILTNARAEQQQDREGYRRQLSAMDVRFSRLETLLEAVASTKGSNQRGRTALPPTLPPPSAPAPALPPSLPAPAAPSTITINLSGSSLSPVTATAHTTCALPLQPPAPPASGPSAACRDPAQEPKWAELTARFDVSQLQRHAWDWVSKDKDWLPIYKYQPVSSISDIWDEWAEGLHGFLSVRELTEHWGARWRRNDAGQRTESSRRKKVIDLVTDLSSKHLWDVNLALRFLKEKYEPSYKPRGFCDYLIKKENWNAVLVAASRYPS